MFFSPRVFKVVIFILNFLQNADVNFSRGYWMHNESLNKWTLRFIEADIEQRYRAHFAESADRQYSARDSLGRRRNVSKIYCTFLGLDLERLIFLSTKLKNALFSVSVFVNVD